MCDRYPIIYEIMWALSFNSRIREQLRIDQVFMHKLVQLEKDCHDEKMRKIAHGIFWNLELNHDEYALSEKNLGITFDIMISYSHVEKKICQELYEELTRKGFRVWIDFDQMHGNVMDTMAHAIEHSKTIIICMSESYRRSSYCRAEADYAFQRQLKIVPIRLQKHYKPDGWLLFLIGQLYYVDFTKYDFPQAFDALMKEIKTPRFYDTPKRIVEVNQESDEVSFSSPVQLSTSLPSVLPDNVLDWSQVQVSQWLIDHNLVHMARLLCDYDGRSLIYFNEYLTKVNPQQMLTFLQEDSLRRTNQSLSVVELARFRSIYDKHQQSLVQSTTANERKKENDSAAMCLMM
ncbi:unnamed protein product [Rotaria sp. Silwood1]|nr:unnamed protein product [Rotaria sp. Silwood1]CAF1307268.1 unnamed protein product [Rotaria sp. Silwood1]CAF3504919.1 unnamed protein product [Rotaria sp. Silwood1]CAF3546240.1 unnamed protein product [Rotaria sp. Silwood1]CAF4570644.1 unnamed protein product [Rotaria sp. Silwood1]